MERKSVSTILPRSASNKEHTVKLPLPDRLEEPKNIAYNALLVQGSGTLGKETYFYAPADESSSDEDRIKTARSVAVANPIYAAVANYHMDLKLTETADDVYVQGTGSVHLPISLRVPEGEVKKEIDAGFKQVGSDGETLGDEKEVTMVLKKESPSTIHWTFTPVKLKKDEGYSITRSEEIKEKYEIYSGVVYLKEKPEDAWGNKLNKFALPVEVRGESKGH